ncbi:MAG: hypothetical protein ABR511_05695 [Acidimicrobiales bacterium]
MIPKLAVVGKGGSGKTVLAALLARALSDRGLIVLAVDLDANPGLAVALGVPAYDIAIPSSAIERRPDVPYGWGLARHLSPEEAVRRFAIQAGDRIGFLGYGNMAGADTPLHQYLSAVREVAADFDQPGWVVVADLAAGPTNAFEGYAGLASTVLVTVEATPTSVLTARRLVELLAHDGVRVEVVVTKARSAADAELVAESITPLAAVPFDDEVRGRALGDGGVVGVGRASPALLAVHGLLAQLGF